MELFKSKKSCKEKFDLNNNWKTAWPRMILDWHLFLRLSLGFVWKMLSFVGKHLSFYPKDIYSFPVSFFNSKIPERLSLVTLVTNYHKFSLLPLVVRPWRKFEKQKLMLNLEFLALLLQISYIFIAVLEDLDVL